MIKSAKFVTSAATFDQVKKLPELPEYAFVGRSNVGKSSLLNMLVNQKNLAVTSSTPGRTRLINFFLVNNEIYFVDLPGYGFAKAAKSTKDGWNDNIGEYLTTSRNLKKVFVLLDIRIAPTDNDIAMLHFLQANNIAFRIIATKADKLSRAAAHTARTKLATTLGLASTDVILSSSKDKLGRAEILDNLT